MVDTPKMAKTNSEVEGGDFRCLKMAGRLTWEKGKDNWALEKSGSIMKTWSQSALHLLEPLF